LSTNSSRSNMTVNHAKYSNFRRKFCT